MNFAIAADSYMEAGLQRLSPHYSAFDLSKPRSVSRNTQLPKQDVANIANWFYYADKEPVDPVKIQKMQTLLA